MIADAERHRDEDRRLRELTDARNELDSAAYQVERLLADLGDSVPVHEKARAERWWRTRGRPSRTMRRWTGSAT